MRIKDKLGWMFVGVLLTLLIIGGLGLFSEKVISERVVKELEICDGVTIATVNTNEGMCSAGCIKYKGEFVPYQTFKYLQEFCENRTQMSGGTK